MKKNGEARKAKIKALITVWVLFIFVLAGIGVFVFMNREQLADEFSAGKSSANSLLVLDEKDEKCALVVAYVNAMTSCDRDILKKSVTDPSQYDDMTLVESRAKVITGFSNIKCYQYEGFDENSFVIYAVCNISISGVNSTPLDIVSYYVVNKDGKYYVDNSALSKEVSDYLQSLKNDSEISGLYRMVKEDEERCAKEDETFKVFYDKLH